MKKLFRDLGDYYPFDPAKYTMEDFFDNQDVQRLVSGHLQ